MVTPAAIAVWLVAAATIAAIVLRPKGIGEWVWSLCGAAVLIASGLLPLPLAARAARDGLDVYLFLAGMVLLAEIARAAGVFDRLAAKLLPREPRSAWRLFTGVFVAAVAVTALLSNDGTILLLTPATLALARRAGVPALPMLFAVAFVANAASFILPISNPANLVVFRHLPALGPWLAAFALPSLAALAVTYAVLRAAFARTYGNSKTQTAPGVPPSKRANLAFALVALSSAAVIAAAAFERPVGLTAFCAGAVSLIVLAFSDRPAVNTVLREGPWSIVPLVAGLFVIVAAVDRSGALTYARAFFDRAGSLAWPLNDLLTGVCVTLADTALNNLPAGVLVRYALGDGGAQSVAHAALIGIDLGPNLSLTGSLATLLWLMMLRRDGIAVGSRQFLRIGAFVTVPSLAIALLTLR